jgi:hypothetical protein
MTQDIRIQNESVLVLFIRHIWTETYSSSIGIFRNNVFKHHILEWNHLTARSKRLRTVNLRSRGSMVKSRGGFLGLASQSSHLVSLVYSDTLRVVVDGR